MHAVLIIGCGSIGERHLRCFQSTGRARLTACDTSPALLETMAKTYGVETRSDWKQVLATEKFDAVVICTPAQFHIPMAIEALSAGSHVLIEKPLSISLQDVDRLVATRDQMQKKAAIAYILHSYPLMNQVRDFLRQGDLGPVLQVTTMAGQHFPTCRPAHAVHYAKTYYRDRKMGGGAIQDALTHTANWIESVVGPTDSVLCDCDHQALPEVTVEDTVHISTRNGQTMVSYSLNQFQAPNESVIQFNTAKGSLRVESHLRRWGTYRLGDSSWQWREVAPLERDTPFVIQANAFLDMIEGKSNSLCSVEAAARTLRFNLASLASAELGARVRCDSLTS